jgi:hypothetical protein
MMAGKRNISRAEYKHKGLKDISFNEIPEEDESPVKAKLDLHP